MDTALGSVDDEGFLVQRYRYTRETGVIGFTAEGTQRDMTEGFGHAKSVEH